MPMDKGGLGIRNVDDINVTILFKWRWRILRGSNSLWYQVLEARYGDICLQVVNGGHIIYPKIPNFEWWVDIVKIKKKIG